MPISQLDLVMLGSHGIGERLRGVEHTVQSIAAGVYSPSGSSAPVPTRFNELANSSFEFYHRGDTVAQDWTFAGGAALNVAAVGADGKTTVTLPAGGSVAQLVAGGTEFPTGAVVLSVVARAYGAGRNINLTIANAAGVSTGAITRLGADGTSYAHTEIPSDGAWYRFYLQGVLVGGAATTTVTIALSGSGSAEIDIAKFEFEAGTQQFIDPSAYTSSDWGGATIIRELHADNIVAGTLTVGGSDSSAPVISVLDATDHEIVAIGQSAGVYGVLVKGTAGIEVSGSGSISLSGGGNLDVGNTGSVLVNGTGIIRAGPASGYHSQLEAGGLALYKNATDQTILLSSLDGRVHVFDDSLVMENGGKLSYVSGLVWSDNKGFWAMDVGGAAAFGVSGVNGQSWGGLTLDKGDVLMGGNTNYVLWDSSANTLKIAGQLVVGTTNKLWLNDAADGALNIGGSTKASAPFRVTAAGAMTATNATITGTVNFGSGGGTLDSNGLSLKALAGSSWTYDRLRSVLWFDTAGTPNKTAGILSYFDSGGALNGLDIRAFSDGTRSSQVALSALQVTGADGAVLTLKGASKRIEASGGTNFVFQSLGGIAVGPSGWPGPYPAAGEVRASSHILTSGSLTALGGLNLGSGSGAGTGSIVASGTVLAGSGATLSASDAGTNTQLAPLILQHLTSATPISGFGVDQYAYLTTTDTSTQAAGLFRTTWSDPTTVSRRAHIDFYIFDTGARVYMSAEASGTVPKIGFLGATPALRQIVTGVRTGTLAQLQTVMSNLLTGLANLGLITNSTT